MPDPTASTRRSATHAAPTRAATIRAALLLAFALLASAAALPSPAGAQAYDVVIRGARVLDGSGSPWVRADVAVRGDRIAAVGDLSGDPAAAAAGRMIDGTGLYLAPGFIDAHTHAGEGLAEPALAGAAPLLAQGITTILANPDGGGPVDLTAQRRALEAARPAVNVGLLVGHGSVRRAVLGMADRAASPAELERMRTLVRDAMAGGAFGLSSGLFYAPGSYAPLDEVVALARVAAEHGGAYQSHIRDEADYSIGVVAAVEEVIAVAREAGLPGVVTHIKVLGPRVWGYSAALVQRIERARAAGVEVWADQYPYLASATGLSAALVSRWALADDGREGVDGGDGGDGGSPLARRLADPDTRARILADMAVNLERRGGAARIQFRRAAHAPEIEGRTLAAVAAERGEDPRETALSLLAGGYVGIVSFNMAAPDVERLMTRPWTMTASDGGLVPMGQGVPHPRSYGTFPRKIREYVVARGVLGLGDAIRTMTSLPARVYGIRDRGAIRPGAYADLVLFDLDALDDPATFTDPHRLARGMRLVVVNGVPALEDEAPTGARPGRVLRRDG